MLAQIIPRDNEKSRGWPAIEFGMEDDVRNTPRGNTLTRRTAYNIMEIAARE